MDTFREKTEAFQRKLLEDMFNKCTEEQCAFFLRIYPDGVPYEKLASAYDLCERTVKKNIADPSRLKK